jgi:hypothetical protein
VTGWRQTAWPNSDIRLNLVPTPQGIQFVSIISNSLLMMCSDTGDICPCKYIKHTNALRDKTQLLIAILILVAAMQREFDVTNLT